MAGCRPVAQPPATDTAVTGAGRALAHHKYRAVKLTPGRLNFEKEELIVHYRFKKTNVLLFTPLLLILALVIACGSSAPEPENTQQPVVPDTPGATTPGDTGASVATAVPASTPEESGLTVPQVDRLRIAFTVPPRETNLPWSGPRSLLTQLSPMVETLLGIDPDTGAYVPMLATRWEMAPDGKSWTLDLREDVLSILTLVNSMPRTWPTRGTSWGPLKVTSTHSAIPGPPK